MLRHTDTLGANVMKPSNVARVTFVIYLISVLVARKVKSLCGAGKYSQNGVSGSRFTGQTYRSLAVSLRGHRERQVSVVFVNAGLSGLHIFRPCPPLLPLLCNWREP